MKESTSEAVAYVAALVLAVALIGLCGFGIQSCRMDAESERQYRASEAYRDCVVTCSGSARR